MKTMATWLLLLSVLLAGCSKDEPAAAPTTTTPDPGTATPAPGAPEPAAPQTPAATPPSNVSLPAGNPLDLTYITSDITAAIILHPARFLSNPLVNSLREAGLPVDIAVQDMAREVGVDPMNIAQITILIDSATAQSAPMMFGVPIPLEPPKKPIEEPLERQPSDNGAAAIDASVDVVPVSAQFDEPGAGEFQPPFPTVIMRFVTAPNQAEMFANLPPLEEKMVDGIAVKALPADSGTDGVFTFIDPKTLLVTRGKSLKTVMGTKSADSKLIAQLKQIDASNDLIVVGDLTPVKPMLTQFANQVASQGNFMLTSLAQIPQKADVISLTFGLSNDNLVELMIQADSEQGAKEIGAAFTMVSTFGKSSFQQQKAQLSNAPIDIPAEDKQKLLAIATDLVDGISSSASGNVARLTVKRPNGLEDVATLIKPLIIQAQKQADKARDTAERRNNLKQIGLAFHNYHDTFRGFPGAGSNFDGTQKGLSWRVHLLPFLEHAGLYEQFHLDEPWDSEHNKTLIPLMPEVFAVPGVDGEGKTSLHVFVDKQAFEQDKGIGIFNYTDGTSNTFLVVEAGADTADVWTKPGGLALDADDPFKSLGKLGESFLALFCDGSVQSIPGSISAETLKGLITRDGGEIVDRSDF